MKFDKQLTVPRIALSRSEVALAIGVSTGSVDQMVKEGALPRPRVWHSRKLWRVVEIEAAVAGWPTDGEQEFNPWDAEDNYSTPPTRTTSDASRDMMRKIYLETYGVDMTDFTESQRQEVLSAHAEEYRQHVLVSPLNKRELKVLTQMASRSEQKWGSRELKDAGPDTVERLQMRGFIEISMQQKYPDRLDKLWLSKAGIDECKKLTARS